MICWSGLIAQNTPGSICLQIHFKAVIEVCSALNGLRPSYLRDIISPYKFYAVIENYQLVSFPGWTVGCVKWERHEPGTCPHQPSDTTVLQRTISKRRKKLVSSVWWTSAHLLNDLYIIHVAKRAWLRLAKWSEKLFQKSFSFFCNYQCKICTLACTTCATRSELSLHPGNATRETGNLCWSHLLKAPLTSSQCRGTP